MADRNDLPPASPSHRLGDKVGRRELRKVQARKNRDRTLWHGLSAAGVVGWSVAVPTVLGVLLGLWLDRRWPGDFSWTLALLLAGVTLGCLNAWYWIDLEAQGIREDENWEDEKREDEKREGQEREIDR